MKNKYRIKEEVPAEIKAEAAAEKQKRMAEFNEAVRTKADRWVFACGGTEVPFFSKGYNMVYVFNPAQHLHGCLNLDTNLIMTQQEVDYALGNK